MNTTNHITYTAKDILQYLNGNMSAMEMNKLEKAALDDPFLADAIEGYEHLQKEEQAKYLQELKDSFAQKTTVPAKVVAFNKPKNNWLKAAAAVLLIGGAGYLTFSLMKKDTIDPPTEVAKNENQTVPTTVNNDSLINSNNTATTIIAKDDTLKNVIAKLDKLKANTYVVTTTPTALGSLSDKVEATANDPVLAANEAEKILTESKQLKEEVVITGYGTKKVAQKEMNQAAAPVASNGRTDDAKMALPNFNNFNANVVAANGSPLPFSNISIVNEGIGTYADNRGYFRLISQDTTLTVNVKSIGYEPVTMKLNSLNAQNKIVLKEVANVGYQTENVAVAKRKTNDKPQALIRTPKMVKDSSIYNVEPADGWDNYNTYVANNLDLDDIKANNKSALQGEVEISFDVQENGAITNIKVDPRNCNNCEEAAKKLIQQGPQWKVTNGRSGKAKVKVKF